jgi:cell wall assembly regulator SMI1
MIKLIALVVLLLIVVYIFRSISLEPEKQNSRGESDILNYKDPNFVLIPYDTDKPLNESVVDSWNKIQRYWKEKHPDLMETPCKKASKDELDELQKILQVNLPKAFLDNFAICNEGVRHKDDSNWFGWFGPESRYIVNKEDRSYGDIIYIYKTMNDLYQDEWNKKWIPFYDWNTNYNLVLDMSKNGRVFVFDPEMAEPIDKYIWTNSYEEWLEIVANEVEQYGELRCETIESVLGFSQNTEPVEIPPLTPEQQELEKAVKDMLQNGGWTEETRKAFEKQGHNEKTLNQMEKMWSKKNK